MFDLATRYCDEIAETSFIPMALKPAAQARPLVGKKERRPCRQQRRREKARVTHFREAVAFAYEMDWPLNIALTVSWDALVQAGEKNDGHCLGRGVWGREKYFRNELARLCRSEGLPFVAVWGRDVGRDVGAHVHLLIFWPSRYLSKLVTLIERVTGSPAAFVRPAYSTDAVGRSICGGWQVNMPTWKDARASALDWADYIAKQHAKHPAPPALTGKAFGVSQALGKGSREAARGMLEAREAQRSTLLPRQLRPASGARNEQHPANGGNAP